jgi:hypothetical protein
MTRCPPAWTVDPAAPAVPDCDEDDVAPPPEAPPVDPAVAAMARVRARNHVVTTRVTLFNRRAQRMSERAEALLAANVARAAGRAAPPAKRKHKGGHPGHAARNAELLALYEQTPAHHSHLRRCALTAAAYVARIEAQTGQAPRLLAAPTVRDALAQARKKRDAE